MKWGTLVVAGLMVSGCSSAVRQSPDPTFSPPASTQHRQPGTSPPASAPVRPQRHACQRHSRRRVIVYIQTPGERSVANILPGVVGCRFTWSEAYLRTLMPRGRGGCVVAAFLDQNPGYDAARARFPRVLAGQVGFCA